MNNIKSVFIRKRNYNYNVIVEYLDENGKLKQKSQGKYSNKKDAEKHLIDIKSSINNNRFIISKDISLVDRCNKYLEDHKDQFAINTIVIRKDSLKEIEKFFKDTKLSDVSIYQVQMFINKLCKKYRLSTVKNKFSLLRLTLKESYRMKEINENIFDFIEVKKKEVKQEMSVYSREEIKQVVEALRDSHIELPILLMLTLGLRFGEAAGLRWQDIDFENDIININKILIFRKETGFMLKEPKTLDSKKKYMLQKNLWKN